MATFVTRKRKDGTEAVLAQITFTAGGKRTTESRTHDTMKGAKAWVKKREAEISEDIEAGRNPVTMKVNAVTLGDAIDKYVAESLKEIGKTKAQVLQTIRKEYSISDKRCDPITSIDIISFAQELHDRASISSASTVLIILPQLEVALAVPSYAASPIL
jgi:hypothetical protein